MSDSLLHQALKDGFYTLGFTITKKLTYSRLHGDLVEYILLNRHRAAGEYDLCCGIRLASSVFPGLALNGPASGTSDAVLAGRTYFKARICWAMISPTIPDCAEKILLLSQKHLIPWFIEQRKLLDREPARSALIPEDRALLGQPSAGMMSDITREKIGAK